MATSSVTLRENLEYMRTLTWEQQYEFLATKAKLKAAELLGVEQCAVYNTCKIGNGLKEGGLVDEILKTTFKISSLWSNLNDAVSENVNNGVEPIGVEFGIGVAQYLRDNAPSQKVGVYLRTESTFGPELRQALEEAGTSKPTTAETFEAAGKE